jgi:hypothetical protein
MEGENMRSHTLILCTECGSAIELKVELALLGNKTILVTGRCDACGEEREAQIRLPGIWLLRPKRAGEKPCGGKHPLPPKPQPQIKRSKDNDRNSTEKISTRPT